MRVLISISLIASGLTFALAVATLRAMLRARRAQRISEHALAELRKLTGARR
jgi:hypothetical protein